MKKNFFIFFLTLITCFWIVFPLAGYTISGKIQSSDSTLITLSGDASMSVMTDSSGYYQFTNLAEGGSYTITPSRVTSLPAITPISPLPGSVVTGNVSVKALLQTDYCGFYYSPSKLTYSALDSDKADQNFQILITACCDSISGVRFFIDNVQIYNADTSSSQAWACLAEPYSSVWNTNDYSNGQHILKIEMDIKRTLIMQKTMEIPVIVNNVQVQLGDVNNDGKVDILDALLIARYSAGLTVSPNFHNEAADVNHDGHADILDALKIAQITSMVQSAT